MSWPTSSVHGVSSVNFDFMTVSDWNTALKRVLEQYTSAADNAADVSPATFSNTLAALERSSVALNDVFGALQCAKSHATEEIQQLVNTWSPIITETTSEVLQNERLFARIQEAFEEHGATWNAEQKKLYEDVVWEFTEAGCGRSEVEKDRIRELKTDLSRLETEFEETNLNNANNTVSVRVKDLQDAPEGLLDTCAHQMKDGVDCVRIPVNASYAEPLLEAVSNRAVREILWHAWNGRGTGVLDGDSDTQHIMQQTLSKRSELAQILGYPSWAHYMMARRMETNPQNIETMLRTTWERLNAAAQSNMGELQQWAQTQGFEDALQPWDVPYYSALRAKSTDGLKDFNVKEYLPLKAVRRAAFEAAETLFGLRFEEDPAIPTYHPDVVGYAVHDAQGPVGVLLVDDFARPSKEPGAWMNVFASAHTMDEGNRAGVINVLNIPVPPSNTPALLSYDDMITVFHELGHALHGLLGSTAFPSHSGTNVARDFVELPSQLLENWGNNPECFLKMARHWKTGETMSAHVYEQMLNENFLAARFQKVSYMQSAFVDLLMHSVPYEGQNVRAWEQDIVQSLNAPMALPQRHGTSHFSHIFGGGYAAGYYSYLWAEILEADIAARFEGNFANPDPKVSAGVKKIYQSGGSIPAMELFEEFQGRAPDPQALLARMGILPRKANPAL